MLKSPFLFAVSVLIALVHWTGVAKAQEPEFGLSFELPPVKAHTAVIKTPPPAILQESTPARVDIAEDAEEESTELAYRPEPLPPLAEIQTPVLNSHTGNSDSADSHSAVTASEVAASEVAASETIGLSFVEDTLSLEALANGKESHSQTPSESTTSLLFEKTTDVLNSQTAEHSVSTSEGNWGATIGLDEIFENGTHSLVARTVGSAEGTRQSDGRLTQAYYGHVDPGNGVWNLGTFSYQHEATSPEEADEKQLRRLKRQGIELEAQAQKQGFTLSLEEKLNGLDLANQAPLAALDRGGYIDRLAQAKRLQMAPNEAILWARTHAYIDPDTRQWNAPGLGNNVNSISRDQDRRMVAISEALNAYSPAGIGETSLANAAGVSLPANGLDSQTNRLAALESSEIAQHVLSEIEVSFGLPPVEASSALVAVTEQPLPSKSDQEVTATADGLDDNETTTVVASADIGQGQSEPNQVKTGHDVGDDMRFDLLPTGSLTEIAVEQPTEINAEEISDKEANIGETSTEEEVALTTTPAAPEESLEIEPEATNKLKDLLSGIPERNVSDLNKTEEDNESALADAPGSESVAEPEAVERPSLWYTEDKIVQTK